MAFNIDWMPLSLFYITADHISIKNSLSVIRFQITYVHKSVQIFVYSPFFNNEEKFRQNQ